MVTSLSQNKQNAHQGGGSRNIQTDKCSLIRPSCVPVSPDRRATTLFSPVAGVQSLTGEDGSVGGAGLSPPQGSEVPFSLLRLLANTSICCMCVFVIADELAQTAAMLAENAKLHE